MSQPTPSQTNFTDRDFSTDSIHNHASLDATKSYVEMEQARLEREKMTDNIDGSRDAEDIFDEFNEQLSSQANHVFSLLSSKLKRLYGRATDAIDDEFSIPSVKLKSTMPSPNLSPKTSSKFWRYGLNYMRTGFGCIARLRHQGFIPK